MKKQFKVISLITKKPDMSFEEFEHYWLKVHGEMVKKLPYLRGYTQNHRISHDDKKAGDGIVELWFDSKEDMEKAFASPEGKEVEKDNAKFIASIDQYWVYEYVII